jgi:site-specific recombinase XerD
MIPECQPSRGQSPSCVLGAEDRRALTFFCVQLSFFLRSTPATDETVAAYLAELADAGLKAATIARRLVVISQAHKAADLPSPTSSSLVRRTHAGIRRTLGTAQQGKAPAVVGDLKLMLEQLPNTRVGLRDRALLLLGFAGAFRRSELVGLDVAGPARDLTERVLFVRPDNTRGSGTASARVC